MEAELVMRPLLLAVLALALPLRRSPPDAGRQSNPTPPASLHYVAHWRLLAVGEATLVSSKAADGQRVLAFNADSNGVVNLFYPVHDRLRSTVRLDPFCTANADNETAEGRRHRRTQIAYHPDQHQLVLDETDLAAQPPATKHEVKPIPGCVLDLLGAMAFLRAQPLRLGDSYALQVNQGGETSNVNVKVDLRETVSTPAGRFTALRAVPTALQPLQHPGQLWIWFSDDALHLPVQIEAKVSWGTLLAQLAP
ncbi:MAG: DUF3108 domain-containing protein [Terriglobales bacterium]